MTDTWLAGKTYVPGSLVVPSSSAPITTPPLNNPSFETGDLTGWVITEGTWVVQAGGYTGSKQVVCTNGEGKLDQSNAVLVNVGQTITAQCFANMNNAGTNNGDGVIVLLWYDNASNLVLASIGNHVGGKGNIWNRSTVTGTAPSGAVACAIRLQGQPPTNGAVAFDGVSWDYAATSRPPGLIFKATQTAPGKSGPTEPAWPSTAGVSVTDNQVTWYGEVGTRVVWQAQAMLVSGATEPNWPASAGAAVHDGSIDWIGQSARITDVNCPASKIVVIGASKIYAADNDIVRYSATVDPTNWTAPNNAGYLATGLQEFGTNPAAAMQLYRSNLAVFNSEGFQMWQLDPDPANITLLDSMPVASIYNRALFPTANDLFFMSAKGIRSMGISASGVNLEAGDVGMPVDSLISPAMVYANASGLLPIATYVPEEGQFWVAFPDPTGASNPYAPGTACTQVFVYSINVPNAPGKWSRYILPCLVDDFARLNSVLYIRAGDDVLHYDLAALVDYAGAANPKPFAGLIWTPWLDLQSPGVDKMVLGFDIAGYGIPTVSLGWDQRDITKFTDPFPVPADTLGDDMIPLPITAPSISVKISYAAGAAWKLEAFNLYTDADQNTP